jgi:hypothetical protein
VFLILIPSFKLLFVYLMLKNEERIHKKSHEDLDPHTLIKNCLLVVQYHRLSCVLSLASASQLNVLIKIAGYDTSLFRRYLHLCQSYRRQEDTFIHCQEFSMMTKNIVNCIPYDLAEVVIVVLNRDY